MHVGQRGLYTECTDHSLLSLHVVPKRIFPREARWHGILSKFYDQRITRVSGFTDFDGADIGETENAIELEP
jgi:hypothetical protein